MAKYIVFTGGLTHVCEDLTEVIGLFIWEFTEGRRMKVNGKATTHSYSSEWTVFDAALDIVRSGQLKNLLGVTIYKGRELQE